MRSAELLTRQRAEAAGLIQVALLPRRRSIPEGGIHWGHEHARGAPSRRLLAQQPRPDEPAEAINELDDEEDHQQHRRDLAVLHQPQGRDDLEPDPAGRRTMPTTVEARKLCSQR